MRRALAGSMIMVLALAAGCGDDDGGGGGGGSTESFCAEMESLEEKYGNVFSEADSFDPTDTDAFNELIGDLRDADPPAEIAEDWNNVIDAFQFFADAFEGLDLNDPEALAELEELSAEIEERTGDIEAAGERVNSFLEEECGIDTSG